MLRSGSFYAKSDDKELKRKSFFTFRKKSSTDLHLKLEPRSLSNSTSSYNLSMKYLNSLEDKENRLTKRVSLPNLNSQTSRQTKKPLANSNLNITLIKESSSSKTIASKLDTSITPKSSTLNSRHLNTTSNYTIGPTGENNESLFDASSQITDFEMESNDDNTLVTHKVPSVNIKSNNYSNQSLDLDNLSFNNENDDFIFKVSKIQNIMVLSVSDNIDKPAIDLDYSLVFDDDYIEVVTF